MSSNQTNQALRFVDSHCHLNDQRLLQDLEDVLKEARLAGVKCILNICTKMSEFREVHDLALKYRDVYASIGVHPFSLSEEEPINAEQIVKIVRENKKVVGIGESGLDYYYNPNTNEIARQKQNFEQHIVAAQETGLPLIIHTRAADGDTIQILKEYYTKKPFKAVLHCFTAGVELAEVCIKMDMYFSASGIITFKNAGHILDVFRKVGENRLLIETDAPYLAPDPFRGKLNKPAYIQYVCKKLALLRDADYAKISAVTTENFCNLFKIKSA